MTNMLLNQAKSVFRVLTFIALAFGCASLASAQQRPLITEDVDIISPGSMRIQAGVDFMQRARYPVSGLEGDLTRAGVIGENIGLAPDVEVEMQGVAQN